MSSDWKYTDVLADYTGQGQDASGGDLGAPLRQGKIRVTRVNGPAMQLTAAAGGDCHCVFPFVPTPSCPRLSFGRARVLRQSN